ncbi:helix-turn-helix domain-containing protein [Kitasatospora sp. NBC_00070]|uniref:helix-turn-helix domain-containing protein n=1 Tax=Kitasatospora sp. NBC_00070 TaxID=2975962 RepID=UPI0032531BAF
MNNQTTPVAPAALLAELTGYQSDEPLRVKQIAPALGVSAETAYREVQSGRLPSYRVGTGRGTIRIQRADFRAYLKARGIPIGRAALTD